MKDEDIDKLIGRPPTVPGKMRPPLTEAEEAKLKKKLEYIKQRKAGKKKRRMRNLKSFMSIKPENG